MVPANNPTIQTRCSFQLRNASLLNSGIHTHNDHTIPRVQYEVPWTSELTTHKYPPRLPWASILISACSSRLLQLSSLIGLLTILHKWLSTHLVLPPSLSLRHSNPLDLRTSSLFRILPALLLHPFAPLLFEIFATWCRYAHIPYFIYSVINYRLTPLHRN